MLYVIAGISSNKTSKILQPLLGILVQAAIKKVNNRKIISHSSRGWKSLIRVPAWSGLIKALFWVVDCLYLLVSSHGGERARKVSGISFVRALTPL